MIFRRVALVAIVFSLLAGLPLIAQDQPASPQNQPKVATLVRVRVSQRFAQRLLRKKVNPKYPEDAREAGIQGQVLLRVLISKNGDVSTVTLISGPDALAPAAIEAVKRWKYRPYLLNGQPLEVDTEVVINFTLS